MKLIIDASVIVKLYLEEDHATLANRLIEKSLDGALSLIVPSLLLLEVNNALVKSPLSQKNREAALDILFRLIDRQIINVREPDIILLKKSGEIADLDTNGQGYVSSYDALYHALALIENGIFITDDQKHYRKTASKVGSIKLLSQFEI